MITHLIDGKQVESREVFETVNPATQEVLAEVAAGGEAEIAAAVEAAKAAFPRWAGDAAGDARAGHAQAGRPDRASTCRRSPSWRRTTPARSSARRKKALVPRAADNFYFFAEVCTRMDGAHATRSTSSDAQLHAVPPGRRVRADLAVERAVHDRDVEDRAVPRARQHRGAQDVASSRRSPPTAWAQLALEAGVPPGVLNVVHGYGATAGDALIRHPDVRAISFTGSTATGNRIVQRAGLKKFSMELGGKSPFVVFDDADLERAMDAAVFMIFSNNGERCTAGSRILVQRTHLRRVRRDVRGARVAPRGRRPAGRERRSSAR